MNDQSTDSRYYVQEEEQSISLSQLFNIVKRRMGLICLMTAAALLIGVVYIVFFKEPTYMSSATAIVRPMSSANSLEDLLSDSSRNISTEMKILSAESTLQSALDYLDLSKYVDRSGKPYSENENLTGKKMLKDGMVEISEVGGTNVVTFTVKDSNPQFCADYVNALVSFSSDLLRSMARSSKSSQKVIIENQIVSTQATLDKADEELARYREENGVIQVSQKMSLLTKRVAAFQLMMEPLRLELDECAALVSSLYSKGLPTLESIEADSVVAAGVDAYVKTVSELLMYTSMDSTGIDNLYDLVSLNRGSGYFSYLTNELNASATNPWGSERMESIQSLLDENQTLLSIAVASLCNGSDGDGYVDAVVKYIVTKARLQALEAMEASYSDDYEQYFELQRKLTLLERDVSIQQSLLLSLMSSLNNAETLISAVDTDYFTLISDALVPEKPEPRGRAKALAVALVLGAGLGVLLAFVLELTDGSVKREDTIRSILGPSVPSLGWTYYLKDVDSVNAEYPALVVKNAPFSAFSDKYRTIANNLLNCAPQGAKVFSVASVQDCEGKTTTACNVAAGWALAGRKVVVVDAAFSHPCVSRFFGIDGSSKGLADVMASGVDVEKCIVAPVKGLANLHVVPSGIRPGMDIPSYDEAAFAGVIEALRESYDFVLVDFPALSHCPDFTSLSKYLDGYVLNVRTGVQSRSSLASFASVMGFVRAPLLGYVFFGVIPENQAACGGSIGYYGSNGAVDKSSPYVVAKGEYRKLYGKDLEKDARS